jgi:type I restriction enzyme, S subunit
MRITKATNKWFREQGHRLDCKPYMSGAIEAKLILESLSCKKRPLNECTLGGDAGIYHAGREGRRWVTSEEFGIPFLGSSDILKSDVSNLPLISKAQVGKTPAFIIKSSWTLVTRSGTIGRMVYSRPDMDGMACSEHVMRIIPDRTKIPPGYLFAYMNSKFGVPLVVSSTYGSIIQSIEPHHLSNIPVPKLADVVENDIHESIELAALKRTKASLLRNEIVELVQSCVDLDMPETPNLASTASSKNIGRRLDAFHFSNKVTTALEKMAGENSAELGALVVDIFEPNRGKRFKVDDELYGVQFLSSSDVFSLDPKGDYFISTAQTPNIDSLIVTENDLLIPRSGQLGGIIGKAVLPLPTYYGSAASEHLVRVRCHSREDAFYLWAILVTKAGYYSIIGTAFGSSIPSLDCALIKNLQVPMVDEITRSKIVSCVDSYISSLTEAIKLERGAIIKVERAIEAAAPKH